VLSEHDSKVLLAGYGIPVAQEEIVSDPEAAVRAAHRIGLPVAVKLSGATISHKTERGLLRLGLTEAAAVAQAARELLALARPEDGEVALLVAEMVPGRRELIAGLVRDAHFGPCVMLGLGGVSAEVLGDVSFRVAPLAPGDAQAMLAELRSHRLFGPFRGEPAVDTQALGLILEGLGRVGTERPDVHSVDLNPIVCHGARLVPVDALVELRQPAPPGPELPAVRSAAQEPGWRRGFDALFEPRGIIVTGVSAHPGKFGSIAYHNLLRFGYTGAVFPINREGEEVLGRPTLRSITDVPDGAADLVFVCTPAGVNANLVREAAARGVRAAFVAAAGYREVGAAGVALEAALVAVADELGVRLAGPNGQGLVSTPRSMCAMIVPPYPPPGGISVASQSGNLVSSLLNYGTLSGVGFARAISVGNAAHTGVGEYLEYFASDPATAVAVTYVEGVGDGRRFLEQARGLTAAKPLVLVQGGMSQGGAQAASSHTGSLASDAAIFSGACAQAGVTRATTLEEAFDAAALFATQPLPRGTRLVIVTQAGGWGVLAADAVAASSLELATLPADLLARLDTLVPPGWSQANPVDLAGRETRDTVPAVLEAVAAHTAVDAVLYLGLGIQAAQAHVIASGPFHPRYGLDRIAAFHASQDARYAEAVAETIARHRKPVLVATELVYAGMPYGNEGPARLAELGQYVFPSAHRAVRALHHACRYARYRAGLA